MRAGRPTSGMPKLKYFLHVGKFGKVTNIFPTCWCIVISRREQQKIWKKSKSNWKGAPTKLPLIRVVWISTKYTLKTNAFEPEHEKRTPSEQSTSTFRFHVCFAGGYLTRTGLRCLEKEKQTSQMVVKQWWFTMGTKSRKVTQETNPRLGCLVLGTIGFSLKKGLITPWKINMEPTNHPFRKENDLPNLHDYVPC